MVALIPLISLSWMSLQFPNSVQRTEFVCDRDSTLQLWPSGLLLLEQVGGSSGVSGAAGATTDVFGSELSSSVSENLASAKMTSFEHKSSVTFKSEMDTRTFLKQFVMACFQCHLIAGSPLSGN